MADLQTFKELIRISAFIGMQSNLPQGYVGAQAQWRPSYLENADFGRAPGWTTQPAASIQLLNVASALPAYIGDDLFVTKTTGEFAYYIGGTGFATNIAGVNSINTALALMPGLALTSSFTGTPPIGTQSISIGGASSLGATFSNQYVTKDAAYQVSGTKAGDFTGYTYGSPANGENGFSATQPWEFYVVYYPADRTSTSTWSQSRYAYYKLGQGVGSPPDPFVVTFNTSTPFIGQVWARSLSASTGFPSSGWKIVYTRPAGTTVTDPWKATNASGLQPQPNTKVPDMISFTAGPGSAATYHQGRVWISSTYQYFDSSLASPGISQAMVSNRILYSEVIAAVSADSLPVFRLDNFIDVPFRESRKVVGLISAGRYLYVFGDRELFILTGNSDKDFQLESLGSSIGTVAPKSLQRLGNSVYWLSDSGVMKVEGGSVSEIGADIRPDLLALNTASISSSTDFGREVYMISDGVKFWNYYAREDAWTARNDGISFALLTGGGTPYSLGGTTLYAANGKASTSGSLPGYLPLTAKFSPTEFDGWATRKSIRQLLLGYESKGEANMTLQAFTLETNATASLSHTLPATNFAKKQTFGLDLSGYQFGFSLVVSPASGLPALIRPPLSVMGEMKSEQG